MSGCGETEKVEAPFTSPENNNILDDILATINYIITFVDGNHEHFKSINNFSVEEWRGKKVHYIITHTCCHAALEMLNKNHGTEESSLNLFLEDVRKQVNYNYWY